MTLSQAKENKRKGSLLHLEAINWTIVARTHSPIPHWRHVVYRIVKIGRLSLRNGTVQRQYPIQHSKSMKKCGLSI
jgi:hypothetical protein